ncbi:uncharacterized [Tachysurus ichikawai]
MRAAMIARSLSLGYGRRGSGKRGTGTAGGKQQSTGDVTCDLCRFSITGQRTMRLVITCRWLSRVSAGSE